MADNDLRPYRRHLRICPHVEKGQNYTKCSCPIWVDGILRGKRFRRSTGLRDWSRAMRKIDRWIEHPEEAGTEPGHSVASVVESYVKDCKARDLASGTLTSYEKTLDHLKAYCEGKGIIDIAALDVQAIADFRAWRHVKTSTQIKELQSLRAFCAWALERKWIPENSARKVKMPKRDASPTMPYTRDEIAKMLNACVSFAEGGGTEDHRHTSRLRARALILLLLYSGLRISDAAMIRRDRVDLRTRKIMLRMEKTRVPVYLTLHQDAHAALMALPPEGDYFLWRGRNTQDTHIKNCRRTVQRILKRAGVKGHPHRFRDTFAVELLLAGESLETVQRLLGHTSIKTTEKHYAPYVAAFQESLDRATAKLDFSSGALAVNPLRDTVRDAEGKVVTLLRTGS